MNNAEASPLWSNYKIAGIDGVSFDFKGLTIFGQVRNSTESDAAYMAELQKDADARGVAVRFMDSPASTPTVATRSADGAPFNSGGYMTGCSTGFAVYLNYGSSSGYKTTTARHCRSYPYRARDNSATVYGQTVHDDTQAQASVLQGSGYYFMFDGAYDNSAGYKKIVQQVQDVSLNDGICTSGGNSGVHCNIQVYSTYYLFNDGFGEEVNVRGHQTQGYVANMAGDSGGPVLVPYSNGKVGAVGMIQGGTGNELLADGPGCASYGTTFHDAQKCWSSVLFTTTRTLINTLPGGSSLRIG